MLVSMDLINKQKNLMISYLEYMKEKALERFEHEVYSSFKIDPVSSSWKDKLVLVISEQLEITSSIRGLKCWDINTK